jgi:hypothetical protein
VPKVSLPPGCRSIAMEDGTRYVAEREGGHITVSDSHAKDIDKIRGNGEGGLIHATAGSYGSGGKGRTCCGRIWYAFTKTCPKCGQETQA